MQLKEPSFFLPLLGGRYQAATCRGANSTHHWLPFQQMCDLPKHGTEWGEMEAKAEQNKRNQHWPFALLKPLQWKVEMTPSSTQGGDRHHGTLEVHKRRKEQTASSSRKFSFRRFMSRGVQKPSEEPLELQSCVRRSLFPPFSPAWAHWAGARTFWCLALIYLFDEK